MSQPQINTLAELINSNNLDACKPNKPLTFFRNLLREARSLCQTLSQAKTPASLLLTDYTDLIDYVVTNAWKISNSAQQDIQSQDICLIAIGGYGRKELFPHSDIDLLILLSETYEAKITTAIEKFITFLWDIGLEVGHSVRTITECTNAARAELSIISNLIEARYLTGNTSLFDILSTNLSTPKMWPSNVFYDAKLQERENRHQKYGNTAYNLEPNVKTSPGGLRDLHVIGWIAKRHFNIQKLSELVDIGVIQLSEYQELVKVQSFLWQVRYSLHLLANKHEDRLLFDYQLRLAKQFGYENSNNNLAVEQFMQRYFKAIHTVNELTDLLLQLLREKIFIKNIHYKVSINSDFYIQNEYIHAENKQVFIENPANLLAIFLHMGHFSIIKGIGAETLRLIRSERHLINEQYRQETQHQLLFMRILRESHHLPSLLQLMNRYWILSRYIPAFGHITGRMQYDLFHTYTVDQHTLFLIKNIVTFYDIKSINTFPLCHQIIKKLSNIELLYLAALFHDIGKGSENDHSTVGAQLAEDFCLLHNLNADDIALVCWLVKAHLLMSSTAQKQDIHDPIVINDFAKQVVNQNQLDFLYLLTVADICATNPRLWNNWRSTLLCDLYHAAQNALPRYKSNPIVHTEIITSIKDRAIAILEQQNNQSYHLVQSAWRRFDDNYLLHCSPEELAWHTQMILTNLAQRKPNYPLISVHIPGEHDNTKIFIHTNSRPGLFAQCAYAIDQCNLNILAAHIYNTRDNYSLNTFIISDHNQHCIRDQEILSDLKTKLTQVLAKPSVNLTPRRRRKRRELTHFLIPLQINFSQTQSPYTIIEIITNDSPGLLAKIGCVFTSCHILVHSAKILTEGERAHDIFWISSRGKLDIKTPEAQKALEDILKSSLES